VLFCFVLFCFVVYFHCFVSFQYGRGQNSFSQEAIDTIMKHLDPPSCVFVFAGYEEPMDGFLKMNPGMSRRIPYRYRFEPYSLEECMEILYVMAKGQKQELDVKLKPQVQELLAQVDTKVREKSNGGMMENWMNFARTHRDARLNLEEVRKDITLLDRLELKDFANTLGQLNVHDNKNFNTGANREGSGRVSSTPTPDPSSKEPPKSIKLTRPGGEKKQDPFLPYATYTTRDLFCFFLSLLFLFLFSRTDFVFSRRCHCVSLLVE
jgi:hypothetical protein